MSWAPDNKALPSYSTAVSPSGYGANPIFASAGVGPSMHQPMQQIHPTNPMMTVVGQQMPMQQQFPTLSPQQQLPNPVHGQFQPQPQSMQLMPGTAMPGQVPASFNAMMTSQKKTCDHMWKTEYGIVGIIVALACFPLGLPALFCDRTKVCRRCHESC